VKMANDKSKQPEHPYDPRADKVSDHRHWKEVLWNAWQDDQSFYGLLHGIRCGGGELTLTRDSFKLLPGEWSYAEWDEVKRVRLEPVKTELISILKLTRIGKVTEEQLPDGLFGEVKAPAKAIEDAGKFEQGRMFG